MSRSSKDGSRSRPPSLEGEDSALWTHVTRQVKPLRASKRVATRPAETDVGAEHMRLADAATGARALPKALRESGPPAPKPAMRPPRLAPLTDIDRRTTRRLAKGRIEIDARLDLHGMRQHEAHDLLRGFLRQCQLDGLRMVLVITGKGGGPGADSAGDAWSRASEHNRGVLKRQVPMWLAAADLRGIVVGFDEAHARHGGTGALYVRLRRDR
jgi:DNA-nicking Smr family endonuclease